MANEPSTKIEYGDDGYTEVYNAWVLNGSPAKFDRMGEWGGASYHVLDFSSTYPDIYQVTSLVATDFDETRYHEKPLHEGWHLQNRNYGRLKFRFSRRGRFKINSNRFRVPNDLAPADTN